MKTPGQTVWGRPGVTNLSHIEGTKSRVPHTH